MSDTSSSAAMSAVEKRWVWTRFKTDSVNDWRPIYEKGTGHPGLGPYWCSGYAGDDSYAVICAWVEPGADVRTWWPEAFDVTGDEAVPMTFSDRFPAPDWWDQEAQVARV